MWSPIRVDVVGNTSACSILYGFELSAFLHLPLFARPWLSTAQLARSPAILDPAPCLRVGGPEVGAQVREPRHGWPIQRRG